MRPETTIKYFCDVAPFQFLRYLSALPDKFQAHENSLLGATVVAVGYLDSKAVEAWYVNADMWDGVVPAGEDLHGGQLVRADSVRIPQIGTVPQLIPYLVPPQSTDSYCNKLPKLPTAIDPARWIKQRLRAVANAKAIAARFNRGQATHGVCAPKRQLRWLPRVLMNWWNKAVFK